MTPYMMVKIDDLCRDIAGLDFFATIIIGGEIGDFVLHSSFLRTAPHGSALAFGWYLWFCYHNSTGFTYRGLAPH